MLAILANALGPIFAKEAVEVVRRKRFYVTRTLYGVVLLVILLIFWKENAWRYSSARSLTPRDAANLAGQLFLAVSILQFAAVFVFVPVSLCGVLAGEREAHTLDLLFTTQLTGRQIVLGKLASRLAVFASVILCGLPVLSIVQFFGGIDPDALWRSTVATLVAMLYVGAHAIYFSAVTRSPLGALVRTYWWLLLELVLVPMAAVMILAILPQPVGRPAVDLVEVALVYFHPVFLFAAALDDSIANRAAAWGGDWFFALAVMLPAILSSALMYRAIRRLRLAPVPFRWPFARLRGRLRSAVARRVAAPRAVRVVTWRWPAHNPLWLRARQARVFDREGYIRRVQSAGWFFAIGFILLLAVAEPRALHDEGCSMTFGSFSWAGVALLSVLLAGASVVGDRNRGFLDLMLVTPLTGREIVDGTLLAVWEHLRRAAWLPWALALFFTLVGASWGIGALCSVITATLFLALAVLYGVAVSVSARSWPAALAAAFVFPLVATIGTALLIGVFEEAHAIVLWLFALGLLVVGRWRVARAPTATAVCCFLLGAHLLLGSVFTLWTCDFRRNEYPAAAMNPAFLSIVFLDNRFPREFRSRPWQTVVIGYWVMLAVNFVWARYWLIRHFDRLVGRSFVQPRPSKLRASGGARERDDVADVGHVAQQQERSLQP
jgi:ABC-type transport system involved in multi-copper enzyme maturation permease subunit